MCAGRRSLARFAAWRCRSPRTTPSRSRFRWPTARRHLTLSWGTRWSYWSSLRLQSFSGARSTQWRTHSHGSGTRRADTAASMALDAAFSPSCATEPARAVGRVGFRHETHRTRGGAKRLREVRCVDGADCADAPQWCGGVGLEVTQKKWQTSRRRIGPAHAPPLHNCKCRLPKRKQLRNRIGCKNLSILH